MEQFADGGPNAPKTSVFSLLRAVEAHGECALDQVKRLEKALDIPVGSAADVPAPPVPTEPTEPTLTCMAGRIEQAGEEMCHRLRVVVNVLLGTDARR